MTEPLGLYLHIPFCVSKCLYCDFFSAPGDETAMDAYTDVLIRRIRALSSLSGIRQFSSVYFGGGTPTALGVRRLCSILDEAAKAGLAGNAEVSLEANPATVRPDGLRSLRSSGFNRISIGVQSFFPEELSALGRIHTVSDAKKAVSDAFGAGFSNISLDLMLGLPGQTVRRAESSVDEALALGVTHLSAYCLKLEPGTPMYRAHPGGRGLPDDDETADIYLSCTEKLSAAGLEQYEISNFARPGFRCRHNLLYWELGEYIGLGPSAHSFFGGKRFFFPRGSSFSAPFSHPFSGAEHENFDPETEYIMLSLRTTKGVSRRRLPPGGAELLSQCASHGLARETEDGFRLTPEGFLVSNQIISDILLKGNTST